MPQNNLETEKERKRILENQRNIPWIFKFNKNFSLTIAAVFLGPSVLVDE